MRWQAASSPARARQHSLLLRCPSGEDVCCVCSSLRRTTAAVGAALVQESWWCCLRQAPTRLVHWHPCSCCSFAVDVEERSLRFYRRLSSCFVVQSSTRRAWYQVSIAALAWLLRTRTAELFRCRPLPSLADILARSVAWWWC